MDEFIYLVEGSSFTASERVGVVGGAHVENFTAGFNISVDTRNVWLVTAGE